MNRFLKTLVTLCLCLIAFFATPASPAQAQFGGFVIDIYQKAESIYKNHRDLFDRAAQRFAKQILDRSVQSTISWANSGFEGRPVYVQDLKGYLGKIGSGVIGEAISNDKTFGFLCSPFQATIRASLVTQYVPPTPPFSCTLEQIGVNYENFINNFQEGGWQAWFKITQEDGNNPYGSYMLVKSDIDNRVAKALNITQQDYLVNNGFLSIRKCLAKNPVDPQAARDYQDMMSGNLDQETFYSLYPDFNPSVGPGECAKYDDKVTTPGTVIEAGINKSLAAVGLDSLVNVQTVDQLLSAFATGLLKRYVFSSDKGKGLYTDTSGSESLVQQNVDLDNDGIPDGYDDNGDGQLDSCFHGLKDSTKPASNTNCIPSSEAPGSPYFNPLCEAASSTVMAVTSYSNFINRNTFTAAYYKTWINRSSQTQNAVDELSNRLTDLTVSSYDKPIAAIDQYSGILENIVNVLSQDKDNIWKAFGTECFFNGRSDACGQQALVNDTKNFLNYLLTFQAEVNKRCANPDSTAINNIPPPNLGGTNGGANGGTGSGNNGSGSGTSSTVSLSCSPSTTTSVPGQNVAWTMFGTDPSAISYHWTGTDISVATTTGPENLSITYYTTGSKTAMVTATRADGTSNTTQCSSDVTVSDNSTNNSNSATF